MKHVVSDPCVRCAGTLYYKCRSCVQCSKDRSRRWKRRNKPKVAAYSKKYHAKYPERIRERHRRNRGLPAPTRPAGLCEMQCGRVLTRALNLDHDHATGAFRGWLCWDCNVGLGKLGDTIEEARRRLDNYERAQWHKLK